jgi:hypothetical protein
MAFIANQFVQVSAYAQASTPTIFYVSPNGHAPGSQLADGSVVDGMSPEGAWGPDLDAIPWEIVQSAIDNMELLGCMETLAAFIIRLVRRQDA